MPDKFSFTKLVVGDLEKSARFYEGVTGAQVQARIDIEIGGRKVSEIVYLPAEKGGALFILFAYHDTPKPALGELILGFNTPDIDAFLGRVAEYGGSLVQEPFESSSAPGMKVAFAADPEGHVIEVVQRI